MRQLKKNLLGLFLSLLLVLTFWPLSPALAQGDWQTAPLNPAYLDYVEAGGPTSLPASFIRDGKAVYSLGRRPQPFILPPAKEPLGLRPFNSRSLPPLPALPNYYDAREKGRVSPVKDQGAYEVCWAFGGLSALEGSLMPLEERDFSENHLVWRTDYAGVDLDTGGFPAYSWAYLLAWQGPVDEDQAPYDGEKITSFDQTVEKHVQGAQWISHGSDFSGHKNASLKRAILDYGTVDSAVFIADDFQYLFQDNAYYSGQVTSGEKEIWTNHEISLVGWDDDFPKEDFVLSPPGDGAFLVKNSWGPAFGDQGYFWLSYYDVFDHLEDQEKFYLSSSYQAESADNFSHIYQYDPLGYVSGLGQVGNPVLYGANNFTLATDNPIEAVGFYATTSPLDYKVYLRPGKIKDEAEISLEDLGQPALEGRLNQAGYHTLELDQVFNPGPEKDFSVIVAFDAPESEDLSYLIPAEYNILGIENASASPGQSMLGLTSDVSGQKKVVWQDVYHVKEEGNICIKAYAYNDLAPALKGFYPNPDADSDMVLHPLVDPSDDLLLSFNKRVFFKDRGLAPPAMQLRDLDSQQPLGMAASIDDSLLTIDPAVDLEYGKSYQLYLGRDLLEDRQGQSLTAAVYQTFSLPDIDQARLARAQLKVKKELVYSTDDPGRLNFFSQGGPLGDPDIRLDWQGADGLVDDQGNILIDKDMVNPDHDLTLGLEMTLGEASLSHQLDLNLYRNQRDFYAQRLMADVDFDLIKGDNTDLNNIVSDLSLPSTLAYKGEDHPVYWHSSRPAVLSEKGRLYPEIEDTALYLIAYMKGADAKKAFRLTVPGQVDERAPKLLSSQPEEGSLYRSLDQPLTLLYDEPVFLLDQSLAKASLKEDDQPLGQGRALALWPDNEQVDLWIYQPESYETLSFKEGANYQLSLPAGLLEDKQGNTVQEDFTLNFTTPSPLELTEEEKAGKWVKKSLDKNTSHLEVGPLSEKDAEKAKLSIDLAGSAGEEGLEASMGFSLGEDKEALLPEIQVVHGDLSLKIAGASRLKESESAPAARGWQGKFYLPRIKAKPSIAPTGTVRKVVEIGLGEGRLELDRAARLELKGLAGQKVAFVQGDKLIPIDHVMAEDSQAAGDALEAGGDGRIDVDGDLVVWTKHFTEFIIYSGPPAPRPSGPSGSSGSRPSPRPQEEKEEGNEPLEGDLEEEKEDLDLDGPQTVRLKDIEGHWAQDSIQKMVALGGIRGYPDQTFRPDQAISRAEFTSLVVGLFSLEKDASAGRVFQDLEGHWARESIGTAYQAGVVNGYQDGRFYPDAAISRQEMAVILVKASRLFLVSEKIVYLDEDQIASWASPYLQTAHEAGVLRGYPDGTFKPQAKASRAEALTVISRTLASLEAGGRKLSLEAGQRLTLVLKENPTTGYLWHLVNQDKGLLKLEEKTYLPDPNPQELMGRGGQRRWTLRGLKSGQASLRFSLHRPGQEGEILQERHYEINID